MEEFARFLDNTYRDDAHSCTKMSPTMKARAAFVVLFPIGMHARTWADISTYHNLSPSDSAVQTGSMEADPLGFTPMPSMLRSLSPNVAPAIFEPSSTPHLRPSVTTDPTDAPSHPPSLALTSSPSVTPSESPTASPTLEENPPNPVPSNPPRGYFNYDNTSQYGPGYPAVAYHNATHNKVIYLENGWADVEYPSTGYWNEFGDDGDVPWNGTLSNHNIRNNECGNVGWQSPIDIRPNGAECFEHHQIRSRSGDLSITNHSSTSKLIESNKLRLVYKRRPCQNYLLPECAEPDPPSSDFPNNWGGFTDVMHVDFKVPCEHTIMGEHFAGEMQIFHIHPIRRRTPAVSVMMQASDTDYNWKLQAILDEFQAAYDDDAALCARKDRRERRLVSTMHRILGLVESGVLDYKTWANFSTTHDDPNFNATERELQGGFWHPHHEELVPSLYFFGYEGSLTEPPCGEWVSWFICDTPMKLHVRQLEQLKRLIFTHVSPDCEKTSVHHRQSVARPIQDTFGRPVWRCTPANFPTDSERMS